MSDTRQYSGRASRSAAGDRSPWLIAIVVSIATFMAVSYTHLERYGRGTKGAGWYSFDANGVHFIGLVNVVNLKAGGLGFLGPDQLEWLEDDLKGRSASTPIVVFAHICLLYTSRCV